MAIDTRDERAAIINYKLPMARLYPNPDGSLAAQADRQQIAGEFPGIAASAVSGNIMMLRHHHYGV